MAHVHINPPATEAFKLIVNRRTADEDFSSVGTAEFHVLRPDGVEDTWTASILAQSAASISLQHAYSPGDVDIPGQYVAVAYMDGGDIRSEPYAFDALGKFQVGQ